MPGFKEVPFSRNQTMRTLQFFSNYKRVIMQINRLLEIVYILLSRKTITAKELAWRFQVSTRTIYRDIDNLSVAGIPVYTERGKGGGISLLPDFVMSKSLLNEEEQTEILSSLQSLSSVTNWRRAETTQTVDNTLEKMSAIFNKGVTNWIDVDFADWSGIDGDYFNILKSAILKGRIVTFYYFNSLGEKGLRRIEPLRLYFKARAWYVRGVCLDKQKIRLFKLTRMQNLVATDESFEERDLSVLQEDTHEGEEQYQLTTIEFQIGPEMAYRILDDFAKKHVKKQPDGSYLITVTWREDDWLYGMVLSYGEHIQVLSPPHLREIIKRKAEKISKLYQLEP